MKLWPDSLRFASGSQSETAKSAPANTNEKSKVKAEADLFSAFGIEHKAPGELDIVDYREMMQDSQAKASVMFKIYARISSGWDIQPASTNKVDIDAARFIEDNLERMKGTVSGFLRRAMLAMAYGMSVHELTLRVGEVGEWKDKICLRELKWKKPENYRPVTDDYGNLIKLQQKDGNDWSDLDPLYFIFWAYEHEGDYLGRSDLRPAYRWTKAKELIDTIWNTYLDKYATPTPIGHFPPGAKEPEKDEVLGFLTGLHAKKAAVIPKTWEVKLLESARQGGDYQEKLKYCDRMIARTMLLPTLVVDEGDSGAYALGQQHADNFTWVLQALGEEVAEEIMLEQVIRPLVDWNFEVEDYPKFVWRTFDTVDLNNMSEGLERLINATVIDPSEPWIRERLDFPEKEIAEADPANKPEAKPNEPDDKKPSEDDPADNNDDPERAEFRSGAASKCDWRGIKKRCVELEDIAVQSVTATVESMYANLKLTLKRKRIVENRDLAAVDKLKLPGVGVARAALQEAYGNMVHWGASDALKEVQAGLAKTGKKLPAMPDTMGINLSGWHIEEWDPPQELKLSSAEIIAHWEGKVPIQKKLLAEYSRNAFTMAGALHDDLLKGSQQIISKGIRRGASYSQIESELAKFFQPYLEIEGATAPGLASAYRIETIVRTNMAEAYNSGRMNLFKHPDVGSYIVAFEYSAVMDNRTTPFCSDWDGAILLADDPRVDQNNPPNHHRCRSVWIPITKGERFTPDSVPPVAQPATGFSY